jgi:hypothetical protein
MALTREQMRAVIIEHVEAGNDRDAERVSAVDPASLWHPHYCL